VNYLAEDVIADYEEAGIIKSVHVQADMSEPDPVTETAWLQSIADKHGYPHGIIAFCDSLSDNVAAELDRHCHYANMRGVRLTDQTRLGGRQVHELVTELSRRGLTLQIDAPPHRMGELSALARKFPDTTVFLGHTGFPEERTDDYYKFWRDEIHRLASIDNVVVKISGLGIYDHNWTVASIRRWILTPIDSFGVDRCVFGTNWPVDRLFSEMTTLANAYREIVSDFAPDEQNALLWQNAERLYAI
jgi:predicted TIM-barrel fold metal-dependent hydrolase